MNKTEGQKVIDRIYFRIIETLCAHGPRTFGGTLGWNARCDALRILAEKYQECAR